MLYLWEPLVCAFQLNSLQAGLSVSDSQIISIIIIRWQETHCRRSARVKIEVKLFHSPLSSFCIRAVCCIHNASDCVSVRLCVFSISLLSVHHWSEWPSWHSANSRQGTQESQPLVRRGVHIIPEHMTTAALSQHRGRVVNCTYYVTKRRRGGEAAKGGIFTGDVSQCIIAHRANRLPVTRSGWGLEHF